MAELLLPKEIEVETAEGEKKTYIISKIPAVQCREIASKWFGSALPKIGNYAINQEMMFKILSYVAVNAGETQLRLTTEALVNNHVPDWETLERIEAAVMSYNCSFLRAGKNSTSFQEFFQKSLALIIKTLTDSSAQSSQPGKPLSKS